ncbi:Pentatricopeptide repeat-containing protein [Platanthera guangdongensis]|uniref:Pentatricopeptide repeat-containing protein n=1 Tax=Platanthera guangdongensis TaxID=2320717 RepID=A0ABR2MRF8_9ASPA
MYTKCGQLKDARNVFDVMPERTLFMWSAMIGGYGRENQCEEVVHLFYRMIAEGINPHVFLLPKILQACANIEDLATGMLLHSLTVRLGFWRRAKSAILHSTCMPSVESWSWRTNSSIISM